MSRRRQQREMAAWEAQTREWATATARQLAIDLYHQRPPGLRPYQFGVVLWPGETAWAQTAARCTLDQGAPIRPWLITNLRIHQLDRGHLYAWEWNWMHGLNANLETGQEAVHLQIARSRGGNQFTIYGPGVAPLAVAAVFHLHGPQALVEHPALRPLHNHAFSWPESRSVSPGPSTSGVPL